MVTPTRGADTSAMQVEVEWVAPATGDSPITSYELVKLGVDNIWESVVGTDAMGSYLGLSYTLTIDIVASVSYSFKIRPRNKWGWGEYSSPNLEVLAAYVPLRVDLPVTSIDSITGGVKITWIAPYENGAVISAYQIEILDSNDLW